MRKELYKFGSLLFGRVGGYIFQSVTDRRLTAIYHAHDFYELVWVREGWVLQVVNGEDMRLSAGDALLLRPGDAHCFTDQAERISTVSLSITPEELLSMAGVYSPTLAAHILHADGLFPLALGAPLGEVKGESEFDCKYLLSFFLRAYAEKTYAFESGAKLPERLFGIAEKMREGDNLRIGIPAALAISHYSQSHLARLLRTRLGVGLKEWINELRLAEAYERLLLTDRAVSAIADEVGFASPAHFSRIFKARFGVSPVALGKGKAPFTV